MALGQPLPTLPAHGLRRAVAPGPTAPGPQGGCGMGTPKTLSTGGEGCPELHSHMSQGFASPTVPIYLLFSPIFFSAALDAPPRSTQATFPLEGQTRQFPTRDNSNQASLPDTSPQHPSDLSLLHRPPPQPVTAPAPGGAAPLPSHQPHTAESRPHTLPPRATSGWWETEQGPKGSERPRRAASTCQGTNAPPSCGLFTQCRCSGDGSSLSKRRAAPLGKQPGVYLNIKQRSCSLDLQPLPQPAAGPGVRRAGAGRTDRRDHGPQLQGWGWTDGQTDGTRVPNPLRLQSSRDRQDQGPQPHQGLQGWTDR